MSSFLRWIVFVLPAAALVVFALFNRQPVLVSLPGFDLALRLPLFAMFLAGMFLGAILAFALSFRRSFVLSRKLKKAERRADAAQARLDAQNEDGEAGQTSRKFEAIDHAQAPRSSTASSQRASALGAARPSPVQNKASGVGRSAV
ncbi:hypothetical protein JCM17846_30920 [Iodidimonas nitroreducens]|uniref:Uncharacterized protein n=1 Tax=Iodidimonas nitroreducens TaxID=1236968 RepID=A0A5A7ND33_9PROT|nr:LapA family protein [Iodidimonas nitroreducens]GAK32605.1 putative integral membrane protein [alpha proteobacterium Q-1]GER05410.1 hypothetical protein JCM17846_30920 [Iodidimonas nitroreducens]